MGAQRKGSGSRPFADAGVGAFRLEHDADSPRPEGLGPTDDSDTEITVTAAVS